MSDSSRVTLFSLLASEAEETLKPGIPFPTVNSAPILHADPPTRRQRDISRPSSFDRSGSPALSLPSKAGNERLLPFVEGHHWDPASYTHRPQWIKESPSRKFRCPLGMVICGAFLAVGLMILFLVSMASAPGPSQPAGEA